MSLQSRREYLQQIRERYHRVRRLFKSKILDEFCANCGHHRKHALRLLSLKARPALGRPGPAPRYGPQVLSVLKKVWLASDQLCSKRLKAALPDWVPHLGLEPKLARKVLALSPATMDRLLKSSRAQLGRQRRCGTKPGTLLKAHIPIRTSNADITQAGFIEADTVAHCGNSMAGDFVWTLTFTDVATAYTLCRAVWNKGHSAIHQHLRELEEQLPFALRAFDCDNGSEFLNHALLDHFRRRPRPVDFTRCRPYHKNDQAHVEQKNWTTVRQLIGYQRLDRPQVVEALNELYRQEWALYVNHFSPTLKLLEKKKIGSRYVRRYEAARTPYQRLLQSEAVSPSQKRRLKALHRQLNPFELRRQIEQRLRAVFAAQRDGGRPPCLTPGARAGGSQPPPAPFTLLSNHSVRQNP
jgi:hypothetical protein